MKLVEADERQALLVEEIKFIIQTHQKKTLQPHNLRVSLWCLNSDQWGICPFGVLLLFNMVHVFHYAMSIRRKVGGIKFLVKNQFKGGDERV